MSAHRPAALAPIVLSAAASDAAASGWPARALVAAGGVALVLLLVLVCDVACVLRIKRGATPSGSLPVRRARLGASASVVSPTAIGYLHPAVIVPAGFASRVDGREWEAVIAHECAHLARGDDWAKAVQSLVLRVGWWLPGLWLLGRALDLERELASDERAASGSGARRYAACLLRLATDRCGVVAPAFSRRAHVAIRVERLLRPSAGASPVVRAAALGAFTATALALVAAAVIALPGTALRPSPAPRTAAVVHRAARLALGTPLPHAAPARRPAAKRAAAVATGRIAELAALPAPTAAPVHARIAPPARPAALAERSARPLRTASPRAAAPPNAVAYRPPPLRRWGVLRPSESADDTFTAGTVLPAATTAGTVASTPVDAGPGPGPTSDRAMTLYWIRLPAPQSP